MNPELSGIIRHILTMVGAVLVAKGYGDAVGMESIIGGAMAVLGIAWSMYAKRGTSTEAAKIADKVEVSK